MELYEKTLEREDIFSGRVFDIHRDRVVLPDDSRAFREVVEHNGGVCVAAVDNERRVYLVEQYRYPLKTVTLEIVAGKLEKGEEPLAAAKRELSEEAGLEAGEVRLVGTFYSSPGFCSEKLYLFLATDLKEGEQHLDDGEFLRCRRMPLAEAVEMVMSDLIADGKTKTLILLADRILCHK